jgi:hypothetical protein
VAEGKADLDSHYDMVSRRVRADLLDQGMAFSIDLDSSALQWATPVGRVEVGYTLIALQLLEQAAQRLLAAGEIVKSRDPEARALVAVNQLKIEAPPKRRATRRSSTADLGADAQLATSVYRLSFDFRADEATTSLFLELCRSEQPVICLGNSGFSIKSGREQGDPLTVRGELLAITVAGTVGK